MTVSIVIPVWNGKSHLEKNISSLLAASHDKKNKITEIIFVDDKSPDTALQFLHETFKKKKIGVVTIKIIAHSKNRGFAEAVNTGFRAATNNLVCLLNQDVVPSVDFLTSIHSLFTDEKVFSVTLHEKGFGPATGFFKDGFFEHHGKKETLHVETSFWASGGSAVFRRNIWMKLKGLDSTLFAPFYWEDVDLGYRAWKRGYKILWAPKSLVDHIHESVINSNNFKKRWLSLTKERNYLVFIWKNITSPRLIRKHKRALLFRVRKHPGYLRVILLALLRIRPILEARKLEHKESLISDEAVFEKFT